MGNQSNRALLSDYLLGQQSSSFGRNYVLNPSGFENVNNISISGSATITRNTTTPLTAISDLSVSLPNDTSSGVTWTLNTLDNSLNGQNCMLSFDYTSSSLGSAVQAQVLQGSNISATVTLNPASTSKNVILNTICGDLGSATTVVITNVAGNSGSSALHMANVNYGKATNIGTVAQAQYLGDITYSGCSERWSSAASSPADFSSVSGCTVAVTGSLSAPSTNYIPGFTVSGGAGFYEIIGTGSFDQTATSGSNAYFGFTDGTNSAHQIGTLENGADQSISVPTIEWGILENSALSNVTFQATGWAASGATTRIDAQNGSVTFSVYYFPSQSQLVANSNSVGKSGAYALGGNGYGSTNTGVRRFTSETTYGPDITYADSATLGGSFTINTPGVYSIVYTDYSNGSFPLVPYVSLNAATFTVGGPYGRIGNGGYASSNTDSVGQAAISYYLNTGDVIRAQEVNAADGATNANLIGFSITKVMPSQPAPILVGSVTSTGTGAYHMESVSFGGSGGLATACTSSLCTINAQSGSGSWSVTRSTTGKYVLNIPTGVFSAAPTCTCTNNSNIYGCSVDVQGIRTATAMEIWTFDPATPTEADGGADIICMGPN